MGEETVIGEDVGVEADRVAEGKVEGGRGLEEEGEEAGRE